MTQAGTVLLIGGSGFVGSAVAARLVADGWRVRVATRRVANARHLMPLPTLDVVEANVHDDAALHALTAGVDAVVSLVGVLHSPPGTPYGPAFARAHVDLPTRLAAACQRAAVRRIVHISALGADVNGPSEYQRSKAAGEAAIRNARPELAWTVLRPSVIFGRGDSFLNLFAALARLTPILPLGGAATRFQPVWVEDVARVVAESLHRAEAIGQRYTLAGPKVYTLADLVRYAGALGGRTPTVVPVSEGVAMLQARLLELAPNPMMSRDNVRSMRVDNVCDGPPLPFGLTPTPLETVAPGYLRQPLRRRLLESRRRTPIGGPK
ncbi:MAG: complex I NDUFA9 subunit family protein [Rhodocyclaceae bacterium]|nr:complex I NDUFA9 subunit family protein [Rhodocyclaceae bacterium]